MFLSKYGVARHIYINIPKASSASHAVSADWTPSAGDVKISKDGGAAANVTNLPAAIAMGNSALWDFSLTATEMQAAQVMITVADSATKAVDDTGFIVETYGNTSAQHELDLDNGIPNVNLVQIDAAATAGNNATLYLKQLNIVNNTGSAISAVSVGGDGDGISVVGNGTGHGIDLLGGASDGAGLRSIGQGGGSGAFIIGGASDGNGVLVLGQGGGNGLFGQGGTTGHGLRAQGGSSDGNGAFFNGQAAGSGLNCAGGVSGHGIAGAGGATGPNPTYGIFGAGGTSTGIRGFGATNVSGIIGSGNGNAPGISGVGAGSGPGFYGLAGPTGNGMKLVGGATSGSALLVQATAGDSDGATFSKSGGGVDIRGAITGDLTGNVSGSVGSLTTNNDKTGYALTSGERTSIADALLTRDLSAVVGEAARSVLNAIRFLRNKWSISGGTLTVTKEDDSTAAWTAAVTTSAGNPVSTVDPN